MLVTNVSSKEFNFTTSSGQVINLEPGKSTSHHLILDDVKKLVSNKDIYLQAESLLQEGLLTKAKESEGVTEDSKLEETPSNEPPLEEVISESTEEVKEDEVIEENTSNEPPVEEVISESTESQVEGVVIGDLEVIDAPQSKSEYLETLSQEELAEELAKLTEEEKESLRQIGWEI